MLFDARLRCAQRAGRGDRLARHRERFARPEADIDAATLTELRREFERIRLARLSEIEKDVPAIYARHLTAEDMRETGRVLQHADRRKDARSLPKILPEAFAAVLPRMQSMTAETQEVFLKLLRERGLLN